MSVVISIAEITLGTLLIVFSLASAFRTVVLPRASFDPITRGVFLGFRRLLFAIALRSDRIDNESVLSVHAPLGLLATALAWALGIIVGFGLIFHGTSDLSLHDSLVLAGSSFTTLGFVAPSGGLHELLAITAAILGLGVVAMLISYLPTIYGLFSRREVTVADVSIKSGEQTHGPDLMRNLSRGSDTTRIDDLWAEWGHWLIALGETHTSEPSLNFFRSPRGNRSWLLAAPAVLDAAILRNVVIDTPDSVRADMTYRAGVEAIVSIAHFFFVRPRGEDEHYTLLTREDFDAAVDELRRSGASIVADEDHAWERFAQMRSEFEPHLLGICELILPPPAPWETDLLDRPRPKIPRRHLPDRDVVA